MRNSYQISKIKETIQEPKIIDNFLTETDINYLITLYDKSDNTNSPYIGKIKTIQDP